MIAARGAARPWPRPQGVRPRLTARRDRKGVTSPKNSLRLSSPPCYLKRAVTNRCLSIGKLRSPIFFAKLKEECSNKKPLEQGNGAKKIGPSAIFRPAFEIG